ncbi:hypothetical protein LWP59_33135 [Amycolatopsis acidiphila]|uniref:Integral membrane protein n=1 Tax=Amycolatopsis acidiphila TaxID=715473 RepID=A0A558A1N4_9PSEU|nr:hypothetical protein [Amycolatopsis acidiphila]TVT18169.1 hypothetical protein FNH06_28740 [Amycolatopsis acidiphila]UIJ58879.1 hypothetical protein LWP59_33135 [Amycolatopsis acidiphila]GHG72509.1 membrane protein [Amycolatopsis acidiphila]
MSIADKIAPAPREVRLAGAVTALPGLGLLVFGIVLPAASGNSDAPRNNVLAEAGFYVVFALAVLGCAAALAMGHTWARSPGVVTALLTAGVGWYLAGPSGLPGPGVPTILLGLLILVLLFRQPSRAWALGQQPGESEEEAAERGGLEGRAAEREKKERN